MREGVESIRRCNCAFRQSERNLGHGGTVEMLKMRPEWIDRGLEVHRRNAGLSSS